MYYNILLDTLFKKTYPFKKNENINLYMIYDLYAYLSKMISHQITYSSTFSKFSLIYFF